MIWDILSFPFKLVGNIVGWALSLTGPIGLIVGIPLAIVGAGMMLKSLF